MYKRILLTAVILGFAAFSSSPLGAKEPTAAEKQKLYAREIVKKRNVDDGHLPTEVTGRASLPDGSPAIGFKIDGWSRSAIDGSYGDDFFDAVTDEQGRFMLPLWRPYLYWLRITDPNGVYVAPDQHLELKEPLDSDAVQFKLVKGIPIEGIITDQETNKPIADLDVYLVHKPVFSTIREFGYEKFEEYEKTIQMAREARTNQEGKFRFAAMPSEYLVSLSDCYGRFRPVPKEEIDVYARLITVDTKPISVTLNIPTPWRGRVLQKDGSPAAFYPVEVMAGMLGGHFTTDKDGYFTIFKAPALESVAVDTHGEGKSQWFYKKYEKETLPRDTVFQLTTPLSAKGRLVRKSTGEPMKNFKFASRPRPYYTDIAQTDENGDFELKGLFLKSKTNLCYLNEPDGFNACLVFHTFKSFVPEEPETVVDLGTIELEESGWIDPNFLKNLPGKAIEIEGITLDGKEFDWKTYRDNVVLIDFWATWCGPCLQEIPHLKNLYEKYHERDFEIVAISIDEDLESLEEYLKKSPFPWTVLSDEKWKNSGKTGMAERFGIGEIPQCLLVDRKGNVICINARDEKLDTELKKLFPETLEEAETFEQIQSYVEHAFAQSRKNLKTMEDQERFLKTYPPIGIAGARKIIALGGDDESLEYGYEILLAGLFWSLKHHPENFRKIEALFEELKRSDKFPEIVGSTRFRLFYHQWRKFNIEEFSNEKFNALKVEAKELLVLDQSGYDKWGPTECILDIAGKVSRSRADSQLLDETLEEMIQFAANWKPDKAKESEEYLRGYCRRMVGSPFALWGKTVDGEDFDWSAYKEKLVLIDFTASWCGPCRAEMPNVVEMYEKYHDRGLEVVCVGYEDKTDNLKKMIKDDKIAFPVISEELSKENPRGVPSLHYGITGIPEIFLIGRDGKILATGLHGPALRDQIEKLFPEE